MSANDDRAQLQHARDLIMQKQFAEARAILRALPHNTTAQKWLAKLDEIAPEAAPPQTPAAPAAAPRVQAEQPAPAIQPIAPRPAAAPASQSVNIALNLDIRMVRYAVGGIVALMAVFMIAGFVWLPWMDLSEISFFGMSVDAFGGEFEVDKGPLEITALEIWMGRNDGEDFTLSLENPDAGGFANVRLLDRFLLLVPFLALVLGWLAWVYAFPAGSDLDPVISAGIMAFVALVLFLFPLAWQEMSTDAMEDDLRAEMQIEGADDLGLDFFDMGMFTSFYTEAYSTGEQQLFGVLALLAALAGFGAEFMLRRPPARQPAT